MLIGREHEQQILLDAYKAKNSEFVVVYGRRRVGKTFNTNPCQTILST